MQVQRRSQGEAEGHVPLAGEQIKAIVVGSAVTPSYPCFNQQVLRVIQPCCNKQDSNTWYTSKLFRILAHEYRHAESLKMS